MAIGERNLGVDESAGRGRRGLAGWASRIGAGRGGCTRGWKIPENMGGII
jgi:hypothetical protein